VEAGGEGAQLGDLAVGGSGELRGERGTIGVSVGGKGIAEEGEVSGVEMSGEAQTWESWLSVPGSWGLRRGQVLGGGGGGRGGGGINTKGLEPRAAGLVKLK
jgi:hypothetical protein